MPNTDATSMFFPNLLAMSDTFIAVGLIFSKSPLVSLANADPSASSRSKIPSTLGAEKQVSIVLRAAPPSDQFNHCSLAGASAGKRGLV